MSNKVYEIVTEKILAELRQGNVPWRKPWTGAGAANLVSKKEYRGINVFLLMNNKYKSNFWMTYKQAKELGGNVKQGEKATMVIFWKMLHKSEAKADGTSKEKNIPLLRYYSVFNLEQTEGIDPKNIPVANLREHKPIEEAEAVVKGYENPPTITHGGNAAFYCPPDDHVQMPPPEFFRTGEGYYSTLFHELGHSTRHSSRLDRKGKEEGLASGAMEELVAEMTSSFLSAHCGFTEMEQPTNHAAYIANWLQALQNDPKLVVTAAGKAQKAADHILGTDKKAEEVESEEEKAEQAKEPAAA